MGLGADVQRNRTNVNHFHFVKCLENRNQSIRIQDIACSDLVNIFQTSELEAREAKHAPVFKYEPLKACGDRKHIARSFHMSQRPTSELWMSYSLDHYIQRNERQRKH